MGLQSCSANVFTPTIFTMTKRPHPKGCDLAKTSCSFYLVQGDSESAILSLQGLNAPRQARNRPCGGIPMKNALGSIAHYLWLGLLQGRTGGFNITRVHGGFDLFDKGPDARSARPVDLFTARVAPNPLLRLLRIRHARSYVLLIAPCGSAIRYRSDSESALLSLPPAVVNPRRLFHACWTALFTNPCGHGARCPTYTGRTPASKPESSGSGEHEGSMKPPLAKGA